MSTALSTVVDYAERRDEIRRHLCEGATPAELELFIAVCNRTQLDPFARQVYAIKRWDGQKKREALAIQVSIDGLRLVAQRSGDRDGEDGPYWCGMSGQWSEVWTAPAEALVAAKVTVFRRGQSRGYTGIALYSEYAQLTRDGKPTKMWAEKPALMLAKVAEALALRKAFPQELSGVYTGDELPEPAPAAPAPAVAQVVAPAPEGDDRAPPVPAAAWQGKIAGKALPAPATEALALPPGYEEPIEAPLVRLIAAVAKHYAPQGATPAKVRAQLLRDIGFAKVTDLSRLHPDVIQSACERLQTHLDGLSAEPVVAPPAGGLYS